MTVNKKIYTKSEAANYLGVSELTLERWTLAGEIAVVKMPSTGSVGRPRNMWALSDLDAFIEAHRTVKNATRESATAKRVTKRRKPPVRAYKAMSAREAIAVKAAQK